MAVEDVVTAVADWKSRISDIDLYSDYYQGKHRIGQYATKAFRRDFNWILQNARENYCKAVVRGFSSKMVIQGWESNTGANSDQAAKLADDIGLIRVQNLTHREMFKTGDSYILVWPDVTGQLRPWPKLSRMCVPKTMDGDPDQLEWLATLWISPDGYGRVNLYYAGRLERWGTVARLRQPSEQDIHVTWPDKATAWQMVNDDEGPEIKVPELPTDRVPAVWFPHDADELGQHGRSILEDVIPLQDALNKSVADLIVGGENFAQPLRALMNYRAKRTIDRDTGEVTTEKIEANPTVNKLLAIPGDGPLVQLDPPDATKLLAVHEAFASKISRVTGLPAFWFLQTSGEPPTGAALRVLSSRQTSLVSEVMTDITPRWAEVQKLLGFTDVRPVWKDPAPIDSSEQLDNAEARKRIGFGLTTNLKELGYDEDDAKRIIADAQSGQATAERAFLSGVPPIDLVG